MVLHLLGGVRAPGNSDATSILAVGRHSTSKPSSQLLWPGEHLKRTTSCFFYPGRCTMAWVKEAENNARMTRWPGGDEAEADTSNRYFQMWPQPDPKHRRPAQPEGQPARSMVFQSRGALPGKITRWISCLQVRPDTGELVQGHRRKLLVQLFFSDQAFKSSPHRQCHIQRAGTLVRPVTVALGQAYASLASFRNSVG